MNTAYKPNLILNLYLIFIMLVLLVSFIANSKGKRLTKERLCFLWILFTNIGLCLMNAPVELLEGNPRFNVLRSWIEGGLCALGFVLSLSYSSYIRAVVGEKELKGRWMFYILRLTVLVAAILDILSVFNGMYFYVSPEGNYLRGPWFDLNQSLAALVILYVGIIIVINWKTLGLRKIWLYLSLIVFPLLSIPLQMITSYITFLYPAVTLSLILVYSSIYNEHLHEMDVKLLQSQIDMASNQIKPHFIYNALTNIYALCDENPEKAKKALADFSHFLRGSADNIGKSQLIPFRKELEIINAYTNLEKIRFEDRLHLVYQIEALDFMVPAFSIQPLVENAIVHGVCRKQEGGTVSLFSKETDEAYVVTVTDDGVGDFSEKKDDGKCHLGIRNVTERVSRLTQGTLTFTSFPGAGTTVTVLFPKRQEKTK